MTDSLSALPDVLPLFTDISPDKRTASSVWARGSGPSVKENSWSWPKTKFATSALSWAGKYTGSTKTAGVPKPSWPSSAAAASLAKPSSVERYSNPS